MACSNTPDDENLFPALLRLCKSISASKPPRPSGAFQKRNIASLLRKTQLLSILFEDLSRLNPSAADLPLPAILCLREILAVLRRFHSLLLLSCSTRMSRMGLALQSPTISHRFHQLTHDLFTLLDIFPIEEVGFLSDDVRDVVELIKEQCKRTTTDSMDAEEEEIRVKILNMVDEIEKEIVPQRSTLEKMFDKLGLTDSHACKEEISNLEVEIRDRVAGNETGSLISLLGLVRYAKCVVFGASTPRKYSSSDDNRMGRSDSSSSFSDIPEDFRCPITLDLMRDPVVAASGQTYDRESIDRWIKAGHKTCPKTGQELKNLNVIPNLALKNLIAQWCRDQNNPPPPPPPPSPTNSRDDNGCDGGGVGSNKAALEAARMTALFLVENLSKNSDSSTTTTMDATNRIVHEIRQLAKSGPENREFVTEAGAIPLLLPLLKSNDPTLQVNAVTAVLNLSILDDSKKRIMEIPNGLHNIVALLKSGASWHAKKNAAATLLSLASFHSTYRKRIGGKLDVAKGLAELVIQGPVSSKMDGLITILNLAGARGNVETLVEGGVIGAAMEAMSTTDTTEIAVSVLSAVAKRGGAVAMGATTGFVEKMVRVVRHGTDLGRYGALSALVHVCRLGGDAPLEELYNTPGIEWLIWGIMGVGFFQAAPESGDVGEHLPEVGDVDSGEQSAEY